MNKRKVLQQQTIEAEPRDRDFIHVLQTVTPDNPVARHRLAII